MSFNKFKKMVQDYNTDIDVFFGDRHMLLYADRANVDVTTEDQVFHHFDSWEEMENEPIFFGMPLTKAYKKITLIP